ncbi:hypothetical protein HOLleu_16178 [Holothuria leucospilota]|uniref:Uncharacterized protein n=1 Tax=Holothuria leucospilota TaxID=206669 RepID=A0A9Q1HAF7_HOLLE|nr:hypothetical protein HOLleu_16178 [Holothuria leucospilota]
MTDDDSDDDEDNYGNDIDDDNHAVDDDNHDVDDDNRDAHDDNHDQFSKSGDNSLASSEENESGDDLSREYSIRPSKKPTLSDATLAVTGPFRKFELCKLKNVVLNSTE